jgi:hypothetical protein
MSRLFTYFLSFILFLTSIFIDNLLGQDFKSQLNEIKELTDLGKRETASKKIEIYIDEAIKEKAYGHAIEGYSLLVENKMIEADSLVSVLSDLEKTALSSESPLKELLALELGKIYLFYPITYELTKVESTSPIPGDLSKFKTHPSTKDKEWLRKYAFAWLNMASENKDLKKITNLRFFENLAEKNAKNKLQPVSMFDFILRKKLDLIQEIFSSWNTISKDIFLELLSFKYEPKVFNKDPYFQQWQKDQVGLEEYLSLTNPSYLEFEAFNRLMLFRNYANIEEKYKLVRSTLENWQNKSKSDFFTYQLAVNLSQENPKDFKKSLDLIRTLVSGTYYPKGKGLHDDILKPRISIETPGNQEPGKPILFKMEWRNLSDINVDVYSLQKDESLEKDDDYYGVYLQNKKIHSEIIKLNSNESPDLRSAILKTKISFNEGIYRLKVYHSKSRTEFGNSVDIRFSNMGLVEVLPVDTAFEGIVLNTRTGNPIQGARVSISNNEYAKCLVFEEKTLSDENGKFKVLIDSFKFIGRHSVFIAKDKDIFDVDIYKANNGYEENKHEKLNKISSIIYTDRKVYRPGQKVLWKVISMQRQEDGSKQGLMAGTLIKVRFKNPKYQIIRAAEVTLNEYSSASGEFLLPESTLPGSYWIESDNFITDLKVEEYIRPKFEVVLERPNNIYSLGEKVLVPGKIFTLNGSPVANAKISYTVFRMPRWRSWIGYRPFDYPDFNSIQISTGSSISNENGEFNCPFFLLDDISSEVKTRNFDFKIIVDATDENNETHSDEIYIPAGTCALELSINGKKDIYGGENFFDISLKNLVGLPQKGKVFWELKRITKPAPKIYFLNKTSDSTDLNHERIIVVWPFSSNSLSQEFPEYRFTNISKSETTINSGEFLLDGISIWKYNFPNEPAEYEWHGKSLDQNGQVTESIKTISVVGDSRSNSGVELKIRVVDTLLSGSRKALVTFSTDLSDRNLFYKIVRLDKTLKEGWIKTKNGIARLDFSILENYEGSDISISSVIAANGEIYTERDFLFLPWTKNKLNVSLSSWRKKYLPGSKEKISLTILDYKKIPVVAEVLAGIYDASLDIYEKNTWGGYWWKNINSKSSLNKYLGNRSLKYFGETYYFFNSEVLNNLKMRSFKWNFPSNYYYYRQFVDGTTRGGNLTSEEIARLPTRDISSIAATTAGVGQADAPPPKGSNLDLKFFNSDGIRINETSASSPVLRKLFNETAMFIPNRTTDANGNIELEFTMPEALTKWNLLLLAHDKKMATGYLEETTMTWKDVMVTPGLPRFVRQGDKIEFTAKVDNRSSTLLDANTSIQIFNASSDQEVTSLFIPNGKSMLNHKISPLSSFVSAWNIEVPNDFKDPIKIIVSTESGNVSDGEEHIIPVLTDRVFVQTATPIFLKGKGNGKIEIQNISDPKAVLISNQLELTTNPDWLVLESLPSIMEDKEEGVNGIVQKLYACGVGNKIFSKNPGWKSLLIERVNANQNASSLRKKNDLTNVNLDETPWVRDANREEDNLKNLYNFLVKEDLPTKMDFFINKLVERQNPDGSFSWMPGGMPNEYMTLEVGSTLKEMLDKNLFSAIQKESVKIILNKIVTFVSEEQEKDIRRIKELASRPVEKGGKKNFKPGLFPGMVGYNYDEWDMSFIDPQMINRIYLLAQESKISNSDSYRYFTTLILKHWTTQGPMVRGISCLYLDRIKNLNLDYNKEAENISNLIFKGLKESAIKSNEKGMYWTKNSGYYWYDNSLAMNALMVKVFETKEKDKNFIDLIRQFFLTNKRTNSWSNSTSTSQAVEAFFEDGKTMVTEDGGISISQGGIVNLNSGEKGTGYSRTKLNSSSVPLTYTKTSDNIIWGGVQQSYLMPMNLVPVIPGNPLRVEKTLYRESLDAKGLTQLSLISDKQFLSPGDVLVSKVIIYLDRPMDFIHLKDFRPTGFEPIQIKSGYQYRNSLGYYLSVRDLADHYYFDHLAQGTYTFESRLRVGAPGTISAGISQIECMYAPEYRATTSGNLLNVMKK